MKIVILSFTFLLFGCNVLAQVAAVRLKEYNLDSKVRYSRL